MSWNIPDDESKTINGLALKIIDEIPVANLCIAVSYTHLRAHET